MPEFKYAVMKRVKVWQEEIFTTFAKTKEEADEQMMNYFQSDEYVASVEGNEVNTNEVNILFETAEIDSPTFDTATEQLVDMSTGEILSDNLKRNNLF